MSNEIKNNLSIEELSQEVGKHLSEYGLLNNQNDRRINSLPDPRTIRYYTTLGLLEPPEMVNRQARYNYNHIIQLSAIKALQGESLTLAEIQSRLYGKRPLELEQIIVAIKDKNKNIQEYRPVQWSEITIEPGLKIMADEFWQLNQPIEQIIEKFKNALSALTSKSPDRRD